MASVQRRYARDAGPWPSNTRQLDLARLFPAMAETLRSGGGGYALEPFVHERRYYWFHGAAPPPRQPSCMPVACTCPAASPGVPCSRNPCSLSRIPSDRLPPRAPRACLARGAASLAVWQHVYGHAYPRARYLWRLEPDVLFSAMGARARAMTQHTAEQPAPP